MSRPYDYEGKTGKDRLQVIASKFMSLGENEENRFERYFGVKFNEINNDPVFEKLGSPQVGIQSIERPYIAMSMVFGLMMEKGFTVTDLLEAEDNLDYDGPDKDKAERVQNYKKELEASVNELKQASLNAEKGDIGGILARAVRQYGKFNLTRELGGVLESDNNQMTPQDYVKTEEGRLMSVAILGVVGPFAREITQTYRRTYPQSVFGRILTKDMPEGVSDNPTYKAFMESMSEEDIRTLENMGSFPSPIGQYRNPKRICLYYDKSRDTEAFRPMKDISLIPGAFAAYDELNTFLIEGKELKDACLGGNDYYYMGVKKTVKMTKEEIDDRLSKSLPFNHEFFPQDKDEKVKLMMNGLITDFKGHPLFWSKPLEEQEKIIKTSLPSSLQDYAKDVTKNLMWNKKLDTLSYKEQDMMLDSIKKNLEKCSQAAQSGKGAARELYAGLEKQQKQYQEAIELQKKNEIDKITAFYNKLNKEKKLNNSKQYIALITAVDEYKNALATGYAEQREKAAEKVINGITAYYEHKGRRGVKDKDESKLVCVERLNRFMSDVYKKNTLTAEDDYYLTYTGIPRKAAAQLEVPGDQVKTAHKYYLYTAFKKVKAAGEYGQEHGRTTEEQKTAAAGDVDRFMAKLQGIDLKKEKIKLNDLVKNKDSVKTSHKPAADQTAEKDDSSKKKNTFGMK